MARAPEPFSISSLIAEHKRATAAVVGIFVLMIAITVVPSLASSDSSSINDTATCSQWEASPSSQQAAYGHLYLREYRPAPNTDANAAEVARTISKACVEAGYLGEADNLSVLAAFKHQF